MGRRWQEGPEPSHRRDPRSRHTRSITHGPSVSRRRRLGECGSRRWVETGCEHRHEPFGHADVLRRHPSERGPLERSAFVVREQRAEARARGGGVQEHFGAVGGLHRVPEAGRGLARPALRLRDAGPEERRERRRPTHGLSFELARRRVASAGPEPRRMSAAASAHRPLKKWASARKYWTFIRKLRTSLRQDWVTIAYARSPSPT